MIKQPYAYSSQVAASADTGIFGLDTTDETACVSLVPVPFEATASFNLGTLDAPNAILKASEQLDLYHPLNPHAWQKGIYLHTAQPFIRQTNQTLFEQVIQIRQKNYKNVDSLLQQINQQTSKLHQQIETTCLQLLFKKKIVGLIGGDHSTAWGNMAAHCKQFPNMGILHFDAHDDLRKAYEGFIHSHASILYNVMETLPLTKLVSVGIRDYCEEEQCYAEHLIKNKRLARFTQYDLSQRLFNDTSWDQCCELIAAELPKEVYVSLDIDGLDPSYCPHTGTPVPGGLSFNQVLYLLRYLAQHDHKIIGFDLVEVGAHEYDANVGARLLYELCALSLL